MPLPIMHEKFVNRRMDTLGRVVVPMEFREALGWNPQDMVEVRCFPDAILIQLSKDYCQVCRQEIPLGTSYVEVHDRKICEPCTALVKALTEDV